eukprot:scpid42201/ scgid5928/ Periplasmic beta-glucosidase; Beta-D-glucoside glucohydrolase; Cellobiase; Gentiobiase; T-cell inhibitor
MSFGSLLLFVFLSHAVLQCTGKPSQREAEAAAQVNDGTARDAGESDAGQQGEPLFVYRYMDPSAPIDQRVADLLAKMNTEEKIAQLVGAQGASLDAYKKTGFGWTKFPGSPKDRNDIQKKFMSSSRLGIPIAFWEESLHSSVPGGTVFPTPVLQGCTWNTTLINQIASTIALEASSVGVSIGFTPVINMFTDARFGRHSEGFSENPTLSAAYAAAAVVGYQGESVPGTGNVTYLDGQHIISLAKHYAAYGDAAGGLNAAPAHMDMQTLFDVYLKPWHVFAQNGGRAVMTSHQTVAHVPCHANPWLVNDVLREKYGFGVGSIISDCNDIGVLVDYRVAANASHAAAKGLLGGVDVDLMCGSDPSKHSYDKLGQALTEGLVTIADIEGSVRRVLTSKFISRLFDHPLVNESAPSILNTEEHQQLAYEAALQGITLVKRPPGSWPPLGSSAKGGKVAIIGPNAGCPPKQGMQTSDGGLSGREEHTSHHVFQKDDAGYCDAQKNMIGPYAQLAEIEVKTIEEYISAKMNASSSVTFARGCSIESAETSDLPAALHAAADADIIVLVVGDSLGSCSEWGDRDTLDLPGGQMEMVSQVKNASKPGAVLVMVLTNGRPTTFGKDNELLDMMDYVLVAWRSGQMGAVAIGDVLLGDAEPTGRLAQSWPRNVGQVNSGSNPWLQQIRGKWLANARGDPDPDGRRYDSYVDSDASPLFPLGYGLSLSEFKMENLRASKLRTEQNPLEVAVDVTNTGDRDATQVVQFYVQDPVLPWVPYWKRLIAFDKVFLKKGEKTTVSKLVKFVDLALHTQDLQLQVMPGEYTVRVGNCSNTDTLTTTVMFP